MKLFSARPKRKVPSPEPPVPHRSDNPMFPKADMAQLGIFRRRVLTSLAIVLGALGLGYTIYGPWLRVETVTINGTQALDPTSVRRVADDLLNQQRWLIMPNRNLWLLSNSWLGGQLRQRISQRLSIEGVDVAKTYPHQLHLTVRERTPSWRWQSAGQLAIVDRQGIVMTLTVPTNNTLPLVVDQASPVLRIDQAVIKPEVTTAMAEIARFLSERHFTLKQFIIPAPTCPIIVPPPVNANQSSNLNTNTSNTNLDELTVVNANPADDLNVNQPVCDLAATHFSSQEIHIQLDQGPDVYFDRHEDLSQAVAALERVLTDGHTTAKRYIDLRFLPRVYVQ